MMDLKRSTRTVGFARLYGRKGYWCVPLWHCTPDGCGCGDPVCDQPGMHPIRPVVEAGSGREKELVAAFSGYPEPNIGIITGTTTGIIGIQFDADAPELGKQFGEDSASMILGPPTISVIVPRTSTALYHLPDTLPPLPRRVTVDRLPGVTLLGEGNFVVAPPTIDPYTDTRYRWNEVEEMGTISIDLLEPFLRQQSTIEACPIRKTEMDSRQAQGYLRGLYDHLVASGFAKETAEAVVRQKAEYIRGAADLDQVFPSSTTPTSSIYMEECSVFPR